MAGTGDQSTDARRSRATGSWVRHSSPWRSLPACRAPALRRGRGRELVFAAVKDPAGIMTLRLDRATGELNPISRMDIAAPLAYPEPQRGPPLPARCLVPRWFRPGPGDRLRQAIVDLGRHPNALLTVYASNAYLVSLGADLMYVQAHRSGRPAAFGAGDRCRADRLGAGTLIFSEDGRNGYPDDRAGEAIHFLRDPGTGTMTRTESLPVRHGSRFGAQSLRR